MTNKHKTKKAVLKRFKVTSNGKIFRRVAGQDHFNAKATPNKRRAKRKMYTVSKSAANAIHRLLSR